MPHPFDTLQWWTNAILVGVVGFVVMLLGQYLVRKLSGPFGRLLELRRSVRTAYMEELVNSPAQCYHNLLTSISKQVGGWAKIALAIYIVHTLGTLEALERLYPGIIIWALFFQGAWELTTALGLRSDTRVALKVRERRKAR